MIKCDNCGKDNIEISKFCNQCGSQLTAVVNNEPQKPAFEPSPLQTTAENYVTVIDLPELGGHELENPAFSEIPIIGSEAETNDRPQINSEVALDQASTSMPEKNEQRAKITLERGEHADTEFILTAEVSYIGRWDADNGIFPDVDLDTHDPDAKVSRKHARIIRKENKFFIEDLGSTNGTFVNRGRRLLPGTPHELTSSDEIIVGKTFLRFHII